MLTLSRITGIKDLRTLNDRYYREQDEEIAARFLAQVGRGLGKPLALTELVDIVAPRHAQQRGRLTGVQFVGEFEVSHLPSLSYMAVRK